MNETVKKLEAPMVYYRTIHVLSKPGKKKEALKVIGHIVTATAKMDAESFIVGSAFCAPEDMWRFCRTDGQKLAYKRMLHHRTTVTITVKEGEKVFDKLKEYCIEWAAKRKIGWMDKMTPERLV